MRSTYIHSPLSIKSEVLPRILSRGAYLPACKRPHVSKAADKRGYSLGIFAHPHLTRQRIRDGDILIPLRCVVIGATEKKQRACHKQHEK